MIRLFLTDIDGCVAEPYQAFDLEGFSELRRWVIRAETDPRYPALGLCSGRAYAYVEAMAQALALRGPALFESGAGRFDLPRARIRWSEALTPELEAQLEAVRAFLHDHIMPRGDFSFDYGKRAQAAVVCVKPEKLAAAIRDTEEHVRSAYPDLMVAYTHVSIDVLPRALTKLVGIQEVARDEGIGLEEIAFIGDTNGDLVALEAVGFPFAPANAQPEVAQRVSRVTEGEGLEGVMEAYRWCVAFNEQALESQHAAEVT